VAVSRSGTPRLRATSARGLKARVAVHVVVRVQVRGRCAHEVPEPVELTQQRRGTSSAYRHRARDAARRSARGTRGPERPLPPRRPVHHQARVVRSHADAPRRSTVDSIADAEVVGVTMSSFAGRSFGRGGRSARNRARNPSARRCPTRRRRAAAPSPPRRHNGVARTLRGMKEEVQRTVVGQPPALSLDGLA